MRALVLLLMIACAAPPATRTEPIVRASPQDIEVTNEDRDVAWDVQSSVACPSPEASLGGVPLRYDGRDRFALEPAAARRLWDAHPEVLATCGATLQVPLTWSCPDADPPLRAGTGMLVTLKPTLAIDVDFRRQPPRFGDQNVVSPYGRLPISSDAVDVATLDGRVTIDGVAMPVERLTDRTARVVPPTPLAPGSHVLTFVTGPGGIRRRDGACLPPGGAPEFAFGVHAEPLYLWEGSCNTTPPEWEDVGASAYELEALEDGAADWRVAGRTAETRLSYSCAQGAAMLRVRAFLPTGEVLLSNEEQHACVVTDACIP